MNETTRILVLKVIVTLSHTHTHNRTIGILNQWISNFFYSFLIQLPLLYYDLLFNRMFESFSMENDNSKKISQVSKTFTSKEKIKTSQILIEPQWKYRVKINCCRFSSSTLIIDSLIGILSFILIDLQSITICFRFLIITITITIFAYKSRDS